MSLPALFLGHGAPDLALSNHPAKGFLTGLGRSLPRPKAILAVSAHWEAAPLRVTAAERPETVHDFYGFPRELYRLNYPAQSDASLIEEVAADLESLGLTVRADPKRGYDHGTWAPLLLMYPEADIPLVQLSLLQGADARAHHRIGLALAALRAEGVLIVGSGSITHNLRALAPEGTPAPDWARRFDGWVFDTLEAGRQEELLDFPAKPSVARLAHPSVEHFLPFYVALGAGGEGTKARCLHRSFSYGSISMASYAFGGAEELAALGGGTQVAASA